MHELEFKMAPTKPFRRPIPAETLSRLPAYRKQLLDLLQAGQPTVSSRQLAERLSISDAQVRRDLSCMALLGRRGLGYNVESLLEQITRALGLERPWALAVVGAGAMGTALAHYQGFARSNMEVRAVFDVDPHKIGQRHGDLIVSDLRQARSILAEVSIDIVLIATPSNQAQAVIDQFLGYGIRGFLNMAPASIEVPPGVTVRWVDISSELEQLTHMMLMTPTANLVST